MNFDDNFMLVLMGGLHVAEQTDAMHLAQARLITVLGLTFFVVEPPHILCHCEHTTHMVSRCRTVARDWSVLLSMKCHFCWWLPDLELLSATSLACTSHPLVNGMEIVLSSTLHGVVSTSESKQFVKDIGPGFRNFVSFVERLTSPRSLEVRLV